MNKFKTTLLMTAMTLLFLFIGQALGGQKGIVLAFVFALGMNFFSYWFSDKMVLKMYHAQEVTPNQAPELFQTVRDLALRGGLPMPKVYIIENPTPNAFATGRNPEHAAVAVTTGILNMLTEDELKGVLAHELSHVKNRDILISSIAATFAGAISMLAHFAGIFGGGRSDDEDRGGNPLSLLLSVIFAPLAAMLIQMAISRSREYEADKGGAELSGNPLHLASALRKLEYGAQHIPMDAKPSTAHMFIVNPFAGMGGLTALFRTHPVTEERIRRLEAMARQESRYAA